MVWGKCQLYRNQKMWEMLFDHLNKYYQKCQIGQNGHSPRNFILRSVRDLNP